MSVDEVKTSFEKIIKVYESAFNNKDLDKILSYWTKDGKVMLPSAPLQSVKQGISMLLQTLEWWRFTIVDVYLLTIDTAVLTGIITNKHKDKDETSLRSISFWEKQPNGERKIKYAVVVT